MVLLDVTLLAWQVVMSTGREWSPMDKTRFMACALSRLAMDHSQLVGWVVALSHIASSLIAMDAGVSAVFSSHDLRTFGEILTPKILSLMAKPRNVNELNVGFKVIHMGIRNVLLNAGVESVWLFDHYAATLADSKWKELAA